MRIMIMLSRQVRRRTRPWPCKSRRPSMITAPPQGCQSPALDNTFAFALTPQNRLPPGQAQPIHRRACQGGEALRPGALPGTPRAPRSGPDTAAAELRRLSVQLDEARLVSCPLKRATEADAAHLAGLLQEPHAGAAGHHGGDATGTTAERWFPFNAPVARGRGCSRWEGPR